MPVHEHPLRGRQVAPFQTQPKKRSQLPTPAADCARQLTGVGSHGPRAAKGRPGHVELLENVRPSHPQYCTRSRVHAGDGAQDHGVPQPAVPWQSSPAAQSDADEHRRTDASGTATSTAGPASTTHPVLDAHSTVPPRSHVQVVQASTVHVAPSAHSAPLGSRHAPGPASTGPVHAPECA